jgi:hypothetical protein
MIQLMVDVDVDGCFLFGFFCGGGGWGIWVFGVALFAYLS